MSTVNAGTWRRFAGEIALPTVALASAVLAGEVLLWVGVVSGTLPMWLGVGFATLLAYASFTPMHETAHDNVHGEHTRVRWLNELVGWWSGIPLLAPFSTFRVIHLLHHAHTNDHEQDPDHWVAGSNPISIFLRCMTIVVHYYWEFAVGSAGKTAAGRAARTPTLIFVALQFGAIIALCVAGYGELVLFLWIIPAFVASAMLAFAFDWLPHYPHDVAERFRDTRIVLVPGATLTLLWQNFHLIHHLYPRVPFYRYAACFRAVRPLLEDEGAPIEGLGAALPSPFRAGARARLGQQLQIVERRQLTDSIVEFTLSATDGRSPPSALAGQHIRVADAADTEVSRCYSVTNPGTDSDYRIAVRRVDGGRISTWLHEARVGALVNVDGPFGHFGWRRSHSDRAILLCAAGSGITPMIAMAREALNSPTEPSVTLLYANRSPDHVAYAEELTRLRTQFPTRFFVESTVERTGGLPWQGRVGRFDGDAYASASATALSAGNSTAYLCGPAGFMDVSEAALLAAGWSPDRIQRESFSPAMAGVCDGGPRYEVRYHAAGGTVHTFTAAAGSTLLRAAITAGVPMPHACGVGNCGTCKLRVRQGDVSAVTADALLDAESDAGWTLPCAARACSNLELESPRLQGMAARARTNSEAARSPEMAEVVQAR